MGNSGTGKTHIALAPGLAACQHGHRVRFTNLSALATELIEARDDVTMNDKKRCSNLDRRRTRHVGYAISLSRRWLIEKGFGCLKQTGPLRQVKLRGLHKVD